MSLNPWMTTTLDDVRCRWSLAVPHLVVGSRFLGLKLIHQWIAEALATDEWEVAENVERVRRGAHPLVFVGDAPRIDQAREVRSWLSDHTEGFAIITGIEHSVPKAQDVLLRVLEESSLGVFLPINTSDVPRLVPTVRSRCDEWVIPPVPVEELVYVLGHPDFDLTAEAILLARGDLDRAHRWLQDPEVFKLVGVWRDGPGAVTKLLLDFEHELSSTLIDMLHAALRQYLVVAANRRRTLPLLRHWPRQQGSKVHRAWLLDQYLLATAGWYGKISIPKN